MLGRVPRGHTQKDRHEVPDPSGRRVTHPDQNPERAQDTDGANENEESRAETASPETHEETPHREQSQEPEADATPGQDGQERADGGSAESPPAENPPADAPQAEEPAAGDAAPGKKKFRTRLWAGVGAAAVVVLAALLVTGLAAPGWMLGGDTPGAQATLQRYTNALNSRDAATMASLSCHHPGPQQQQKAVKQLNMLQIHAAVTKPAAEKDTSAKGTVRVTAVLRGKQRAQSGPVQLKKVHNRWCIS